MTDTEKMANLIKTSKKNWGHGPTVINGVEFWMVGRNASHEFYVGQFDYTFMTYSAGEGAGDPLADDYPGDDRHFTLYQSFSDLAEKAYLGHL